MSSAPAGVADSDPGEDCGRGEMKREGQPKLADAAAREPVTVQGNLVGAAGEADVLMVEATEEEVAAVAGVKVEGKVAGKVSDSLYATESASMVGAEGYGNESAENMQALNGGGEREGILGVEAGGSQSEAERKQAQVEPITAETVEVSDSTSQYPEAGNTAHGSGQFDVLPIDYTFSPQLVWHHRIIFIHNCAEFNRDNQRARYRLPPLDKDGFRVSSLVWSKLKGHPWWPGEIFDPSNASELALKHQKKGNHLVAYCGDTTFAWCDESQLKPFMTNYSQMEKQSSSDAFINAVNHALEELSRRILSGMSCSCLPEGLTDNGMSYMVENSGLRDGVTCSTVKQAEILEYFSPENLLHYVKSLALSPGQGGDLLDLVIACSQLTSFYRSKGCPELASFQTGSAWVDNGIDTYPTKNAMLGEVVTVEVQPSHDKSKRGRGRPRKQKPEDYLELMDERDTSNLSNDTACDDPVDGQMVMDFDDFDVLKNKKKGILDSFEDSETKSSTTTFGSCFKIGECIRRVASHLTASSSIVKLQNEPTMYKNTAEAECGEFDISSDDAINELTVKKRTKRRCLHRHHFADPKELLSQICSVAIAPMNGYSFSAMIISYFSDFRDYIVSTINEANIIKKSTAKRGGKRKVLPSDVETTDHMQDSYWSGLSLHNHPFHSLRGASTNTRPRRRNRASRDTNLPSVQHLQPGTLGPKKQIQVIERSIIHVDEKMVNECKPTALVLSFGRSTGLPSEADLIKMFGRYGPLKESETEVHKNTNTVKVVFKKRADAERAFSAASKFVTFGPLLHSYRLVNMPFTSDAKLEVEAVTTEQVGQVGAEQVKVPMEESTTVISDVLPAETSEVQEQSETVQFEAVCETSLAQEGTYVEADTVEDLTKPSAHEAGSNKQIVGSETAAEVSAKQVCSVEQTVKVEAVTEASGGEIEVGKQIADVAMADATTMHSVMVEGAVESKVEAPVDETVENKGAAETLAGETAEGETTAEVPDENLENKATAEAPCAEIGEGETRADVPDENEETNNKATAEALAGETAESETTAEAPVVETTTAEKTVEDTTVEAPDEKTTTAEKTVEDATVEARAPDEIITAAGKDGTVEAQDGQTGVAEQTG